MEWNTCKCCGQVKPIQNKTKGFCSDCVYKQNHNGKNQFEVAREKQKQKVYLPKPIVSKFKSSGERELFQQIWNERAHYCEHCGKFLGSEAKSFFFSHKISKGKENSLRLDSDNIQLLCFDCHFAYDFQGEKVFNSRKNLHIINGKERD